MTEAKSSWQVSSTANTKLLRPSTAAVCTLAVLASWSTLIIDGQLTARVWVGEHEYVGVHEHAAVLRATMVRVLAVPDP